MLRFPGLRREFESVTPESLQVAAQGLCPELGMGHNQTGLLSLHLWGALAALSWGHGKGKFVSDTRRLFTVSSGLRAYSGYSIFTKISVKDQTGAGGLMPHDW